MREVGELRSSAGSHKCAARIVARQIVHKLFLSELRLIAEDWRRRLPSLQTDLVGRFSAAASGVEEGRSRLLPPAYATAEGTGQRVPMTTRARVARAMSAAMRRPLFMRPYSRLLSQALPGKSRPSVSRRIFVWDQNQQYCENAAAKG